MNSIRSFGSARRSICAVLAASLLIATNVVAQTVTVGANADIYRAGNAPLLGDGGVNPVLISVPADTLYFSFSSVTGSFAIGSNGAISLNSGGGFNNPDGVVVQGTDNGPTIGNGQPPGYSFNLPFGGLSGITEPGIGGLVGVFESPTSLGNPAPASPSYLPNGNTAVSTSPLLDQVFLIGDGLTGDGTGTLQQFDVPTGATELFLGISDAPGFDGANGPGAYGDNIGSYSVTYGSTPVSAPDGGATITMVGGVLSGLALLRRRLAR